MAITAEHRLPAQASRFEGVRSDRARVVVGAGLILFLELVLIRWLGALIVHLSYFTNFVLLGAFLGVGLGFLTGRRRPYIAPWSPVILVALVALVTFVPVQIDRRGDEVIYFSVVEPSGPPAWVILPFVFVAVAASVMGLAQLVARSFRELPPLDAYRLDLVGSLAGIVLFTALAFAGAPPLVWVLVIVPCFVALLGTARIVTFSCALLVALAVGQLHDDVSWSPYYRISHDRVDYGPGDVGLSVSANGIPHQVARGLDGRLRQDPQYRVPYERVVRESPGRVLIIGAGTGNDVAVALAEGAEHVDAVEIDPAILRLGKERHPDRPYDNPRVAAHVDDGRAFLERTNTRYDLVLFALPDSLALVTGSSAIRLESFLFTREAFLAARERLTSGGGFAMYNYYREDWLVDRYVRSVAEVFGHAPCLDRVERALGQSVITVARDPRRQRCATRATLAARAESPATDDRPFPYYRGGGFPLLYVTALLGILLLSAGAVRAFAGRFRSMRPYADLFFMGAAFLLLETRSVTTFALLFGTTWIVNAVVFAGVLSAILLAVELTRRVATPSLTVLYAGIAGALVLAYAVPNGALLGLPVVPRALAAIALAFTPIFLANLAFAKRFAHTADAPSAFGINILGAMVGGCVEYLALVIGFRSLLIVAAAFYLAAFVLLPRRAPARA